MEIIERKVSRNTNDYHVTWFVKSGFRHFIIDWNSCPFDTGKPEAMAFLASQKAKVTKWNELAVSYKTSPEDAIKECIHKLRIKGFIYE